MTKFEYLKYYIIYTFKRWTWQLRSFPEVRGMGYHTYYKTYLRNSCKVM